MKYLVVIAAGLTDRPIAEKDNKTPLQLAETPNLDALVKKECNRSIYTNTGACPEHAGSMPIYGYILMLRHAPGMHRARYSVHI